MFKRLTKRVRNDTGDSTLVSTIIVIPLLIMMFFTVIDMSVWFNNRSMLTGIARDGARTVAIMGGTHSPLADDYGVGEVEENLVDTIYKTPGLISVSEITRDNVTCGPRMAMGVGEETFCEFDWVYNGVGLSVFALLANNDDYSNVGQGSDSGHSVCTGKRDSGLSALTQNCTRGTAESEVRFG